METSEASQLERENADLRQRLEESEEVLRAIRSGEVDAFVVDGQLFRLESAEAASNRFRGEILEEVADAVVAVDAENRITFLNGAAARMYGVEGPEVLGRHIGSLFHERWASADAEEAARITLDVEGNWRGETVHITSQGEELSVESSVSTQRDGARTRIGQLAIVRDITRRKLAQRAVEMSHAQFAEISRAFRGITENSPDLISRFDRDHRHRYVNPAVSITTGLQAEHFLGKTHRELGLAEEYCLSWEKAQDRVFDLGEKTTLEFSYETPASGRSWYHALLVPEYNLAGEVEFVLTIVRDITALHKSTETLRHSEERFRVLAETLPDIIFTADASGARDYHNPQFYELTGLPTKSADGWGWLAAVHPDDVERVRARWASATDSGGMYRDEYRYRTRAGKYRWFSSRAHFIRDNRGLPVKWLGACTDVNDHKQSAALLEQTVAERTSKLQETVSELEAFSYSISHDLRAPLRAMHSYAAFLRNEYGDSVGSEGKEYIRRIIAAADRMDRLIQDVLVYSRVTRSELALEPVELESFIPALIESYPQFAASAAVIEIEGVLSPVQANQAALTQCLSNLLGNAIKFVAPGIVPHIRIWSTKRDSRVSLFIRDNGIGIDPSQQARIFEIFQQLNPSQGGTGIGLAVVRKAAERMGGHVKVSSEKGEGSTFCLELASAPTT